MIKIGLTGFGDHDELYGKIKPAERLPAYCAHFPIVEIDSSFYAVQPVRNYVKWASQTPDNFQFIVKAYQGMTRHLRGKKIIMIPPVKCMTRSIILSHLCGRLASWLWHCSSSRPGLTAPRQMWIFARGQRTDAGCSVSG